HATGHAKNDSPNNKNKENCIKCSLSSDNVGQTGVYWLNNDNSEGEGDAGPECGE
ncbi:uncharacterized protein BO87DRAFT_288671, partial [Aspergillus neoniger CBS 115656]